MRLHQLTLRAFGSFGSVEEVDFDALSEAGLFLLHGPTGAGKTTILDAVSFALFGRLAGVRGAGEGLRSHHVRSADPTEVRLEVTIRGRRFRLWRQPRQQLPKRRGSGTREHPAKATVSELVDGEWVSRAERPTDADAFVQDALGMGADQFHQIVMLPQGDFARFLRASPEDRRGVLERLFATERFADVERWLQRAATEAADAVAGITEEVRRSLVAAATISGADRFSDESSLAAAAGWLTSLEKDATDRLAAAAAAEGAARTEHEKAKDDLAATSELASRQTRHAGALDDRAALAEVEREATAARCALDRARRAAPGAPLVEALADAETIAAGAGSKRAEARERLGEVIDDLECDEPGWCAGRLDEIVAALAKVESLVGEEDELAHLVVERDGITKATKAGRDRIQELTSEQAERRDGHRADAEALVAARAAANRTAECTRRVEAARRAVDVAGERDALVDQVGAAAELRLDRHDAERKAYERFLALVEAQPRTRAAALAQDLVDGEPCLVCGGREHPAPATAGEELVTDAEIATARGRLSKTKKQADAATAEHSALQARLDAARVIAGDATAAELDRRLEEAELEAAEQGELAAGVGPLERRLVAADEADQAARGELDRLEQSSGSARERKAVLDAAISALRGRLTEARSGYDTLADRRVVLDGRREAIVAFVAAHDDAAHTDRAATSARERAEVVAADGGFDDLASARAAALDEATIEQLASTVAEHDRRLAAVEAELTKPELVCAAAEPPADVAAATERAEATERALQEAATKGSEARATQAGLARCSAGVSARLVELGPLSRDYETKRSLADLANGNDVGVEPRMRLSNYVLAARLEQVAAAASERLRRMSSDRYTLVHTADEGDGRRKGGLGLRVVDAWTGTERPTESLSGGESFYASLALALGVADVVAAEAGGVQMETMFIDEGFGALDDATLGDVMDVLDGLRAGGRAIGVVSHVADLRSRIAVQLEIVPGGPDGSTIRAA